MSRSNSRQGPGLAAHSGLLHHAGAAEAAWLGDAEVDVDHLLLGLLATGGPSAGALHRAGVGLEDLRRGVRELQQHDLGLLGVSAAVPAPGGRAADSTTVAPLPLAGRVRELLEGLPLSSDDGALLLALLDDVGGRARRLLEHLRVDVDRLRHDLEHEDEEPEVAASPTVPELPRPAPAGALWMTASYHQHLPVPGARVWALVADPDRRAEWDATRPAGAAREVVTHLAEGEEIAWARAEGTGDGVTRTVQLRLEPRNGATLLHLRSAVLVRGWSWHLLRPVLERLVRGQLRTQAHLVAQAASRPAPPDRREGPDQQLR